MNDVLKKAGITFYLKFGRVKYKDKAFKLRKGHLMYNHLKLLMENEEVSFEDLIINKIGVETNADMLKLANIRTEKKRLWLRINALKIHLGNNDIISSIKGGYSIVE